MKIRGVCTLKYLGRRQVGTDDLSEVWRVLSPTWTRGYTHEFCLCLQAGIGKLPALLHAFPHTGIALLVESCLSGGVEHAGGLRAAANDCTVLRTVVVRTSCAQLLKVCAVLFFV